MQAVDAPQMLGLHAQEIVDAGYHGFLRYISPNTRTFRTKRLRSTEVDQIRAVSGTRIGLIYERLSNSISWFTSAHAHKDASDALAVCESLGVPPRIPVFFTVDFDASRAQIDGKIHSYMQIVFEELRASGRTAGVYGSGLTCKILKEAGLVNATWLSLSIGWSEHDHWKSQADIVQHATIKIGRIPVDANTVVNEAVLW